MNAKKRLFGVLIVLVVIVAAIGLVLVVNREQNQTELTGRPATTGGDPPTATVLISPESRDLAGRSTDSSATHSPGPSPLIPPVASPAGRVIENPTVRPADSPVEFRGVVTFPTSYSFQGTAVGGLSALAYHPERNVYYVLSDDRGRVGAPRFYTVTLDISDGNLDEGDVVFTGVGFLKDENGQPYTEGSLDPEGLTLTEWGTLFISSEGDTEELIDPFIREYGLDGRALSAFPLPEKFLPAADGSRGVRDNLSLESLTRDPAGNRLYTAVENALYQDGPEAGLDTPSPVRILAYDLASGRPGSEYMYVVEPVPASPLPAGEISNGLVELIALDDHGNFLALERAYSAGVGNTIILYTVQLAGAEDVSGVAALAGGDPAENTARFRPVAKQFLFDVGTVLGTVDNVEGMALGPLLPDGRQSLIMISDNNFNRIQQTQFILLALGPPLFGH